MEVVSRVIVTVHRYYDKMPIKLRVYYMLALTTLVTFAALSKKLGGVTPLWSCYLRTKFDASRLMWLSIGGLFLNMFALAGGVISIHVYILWMLVSVLAFMISFKLHDPVLTDNIETQLVHEALPDLKREAIHDLVQSICFGLPRDQRGYEVTRQKVITKLEEAGAQAKDIVQCHPHIMAAYWHVSAAEQAVYNRINRPVDVLVQMQSRRNVSGGAPGWAQAAAAGLGLWPDRKH